MVYMVEIELVKSDNTIDPKHGIDFIEQIMKPTLEICIRWRGEKRIIAGGLVSGASKLAFMMEVDSVEELDLRLMTLPLWAVAKTTVTPLIKFEDRIVHVERKAERLRALLNWPGHTRPTEPL